MTDFDHGWVIEDASTPVDSPSYFCLKMREDIPGVHYPRWNRTLERALMFARQIDAVEYAEVMVKGDVRVTDRAEELERQMASVAKIMSEDREIFAALAEAERVEREAARPAESDDGTCLACQ
jgi:hypothetical protein